MNILPISLQVLLVSVLFLGCPKKSYASGVEGHDNEFSILVYNVENVFDLDGISIFGEYSLDPRENPFPYSGAKLLTKINNHADIIKASNSGKGADIVALQELEVDFSQDCEYDLVDALATYEEQTVEEMLTQDPVAGAVRGLPVEFFLVKRLAELGLDDYQFYGPKHDDSWQERHIAHRSAYLSRFDVKELNQFSMAQARDVLLAEFEVGENSFLMLNNHWKSGASSPRSEPTRVKNAKVVRALLDGLLHEDPKMDVVLVGDFNSHHNQTVRLGDSVEMTGMNDILRSQSNERAVFEGTADLYNLWYELPQQQRGSEVWMGEWGTLMQVVITPGLYDQKGIQYVDGSFGVLSIPGVNVSKDDGTPLSWVNIGNGKGFSDHLPVEATFRFDDSKQDAVSSLPAYDVETLGSIVETDHTPILVDFSLKNRVIHPDPSILSELGVNEVKDRIGELYQINNEKVKNGVAFNETFYTVYSPNPEARDWFRSRQEGDAIAFVGEFGVFRGQLQFIIRDPSWVE